MTEPTAPATTLPPAPPATAPATTPQTEPTTPATIPYERFKEVNDKAKTLETRLAELENGQKTAQEAALKEQNKYKELYEQREKELKAEKTNNLRLRVATSKGLPMELVDRLRGETEDDMTKDADALLAFLKPAEPKTPPGVPPLKLGTGASQIDFSTETDAAKIREAYDKLNK